jgi:hypothetical protein
MTDHVNDCSRMPESQFNFDSAHGYQESLKIRPDQVSTSDTPEVRGPASESASPVADGLSFDSSLKCRSNVNGKTLNSGTARNKASESIGAISESTKATVYAAADPSIRRCARLMTRGDN